MHEARQNKERDVSMKPFEHITGHRGNDHPTHRSGGSTDTGACHSTGARPRSACEASDPDGSFAQHSSMTVNMCRGDEEFGR